MKLKVKPRLYQEKIFHTAVKKNTLVILPTGLGKTIIAFMAIVKYLKDHPEKKVLFLAPTKPICEQQKKSFEEKVEGIKSVVLTGKVKPEERKKLWKEYKVFFSTPQTVSNDLLKGFLDLSEFSLVIFDEAHRASGEYDYVFIAKQFINSNPSGRIIGLTASPGDSAEKIEEIKKNLFIEEIESRDENSEDIKEYIKKKKIEKIFIELPEEFKEIKEILERVLREKLRNLKTLGILESADINKVKKSDLLQLQGKLIKSDDPEKYLALSKLAQCIKLMHALELLQIHGVAALTNFIDKLKKQRKVKASMQLFEDLNFREAIRRAYELSSKGYNHPKFEKLKEIMRNIEGRTIIFTQYVDTAKEIVKELEGIEELKPVLFMGQRKGYTQKKQLEILEKFREGKYNVLVATSIGEEGLDIKGADVGIIFEPVPSALRTIQRIGRIGRFNFGKIIILITKDTIDEKYYWVAFHKEKRMKEIIKEMKSGKQRGLTEWTK